MNRTKIEYADYTWNPVTGCLHGCSYCYARRMAERGLGEYGKHPKGERFNPRFHPERLGEPATRKKPSKIFVCSMGDIFSPGVHWEWLQRVRYNISPVSRHTYLWLTKKPLQYSLWDWYSNDWVGATVTRHIELYAALRGLKKARGAGVRFISFEPLLGPITMPEEAADVLDWIIIGAQTGPGAREHQPSYDRLQSIVWFADRNRIPVFIKDNVIEWPEKRQEYPTEGEQ